MGKAKNWMALALRKTRGKCSHTGRAVAIIGVDVKAYACRKCDAVGVRSMGRANDSTQAVKVEMRAAEIALSARGKPGHLRGEDEASGNCDHFTGGDLADEDPRGWLAGWLSAEIRSHESREIRDATAWAWDISRPLAEQLAETADDNAAADALEPWSRPVDSQECAIRRECTNKCGRKDQMPTDRPPDRLAGCASCEVPFGCRDGHCLHEREAERKPVCEGVDVQAAAGFVCGDGVPVVALDATELASGAEAADYDLQAGGPAMTTAEILAAYFDVPPALPADGDLSKLPVLNLDAMEYELTRDAEPDCRDEDGPEVERIMAEVEGSNG